MSGKITIQVALLLCQIEELKKVAYRQRYSFDKTIRDAIDFHLDPYKYGSPVVELKTQPVRGPGGFETISIELFKTQLEDLEGFVRLKRCSLGRAIREAVDVHIDECRRGFLARNGEEVQGNLSKGKLLRFPK